MGFFEKIKKGLEKTKNSFVKQIEDAFNRFTKIDEELFEELEEILILADVGVDTSAKICDNLRKRIKQTGTKEPSEVKNLLKNIITEMLSDSEGMVLNTKPSIILVIGVNGAGKTTTIGKLSYNFKEEGKSVMLAAADTFRAAAIDQLDVWAKRAGVPMIRHNEGSDPAAVVYDAIKSAKSKGTDIIICDTAGRLHNKKNLMDELNKIFRVIERESDGCDKEVLLVLDATTGQNGVNQAKQFKDSTGITGIILTKMDGTAKGGVIISIKEELGLPVKYVGVGEKIDDLQPFIPEQFADALFN